MKKIYLELTETEFRNFKIYCAEKGITYNDAVVPLILQKIDEHRGKFPLSGGKKIGGKK